MTRDPGRSRDWIVAILLFVASALYFASYARVGLFDDEGYLLEGVTRILDGQVIYRDFHHTYAPGRFYLLAALFELFGENLLVVRATWVALRALIVVLAWRLARRLVSGPLVWAPPLALLALPGPWHKSFFHLFLIACALGGEACLSRGGRGRSFWAGALIAVAILFRQDVGAFAAAAIGGYAAVRAIAAMRAPAREPLASLRWMIAGGAAVIAPVALYFASNGALGHLVSKVFFAGVRDNRTNELPFPPVWPLVPAGAGGGDAALALLFVKALYYLPLATFAIFGAWLLARAARERALPSPAAWLTWALGTSALLQVAARSDFAHLCQAIGMVYFVWAIGAERLVNALGRRTEGANVEPRARARIAATAAALALPLLLTAGLYGFARVVNRPAGAAYLARAGVVPPAENAAGARVFLAHAPRTRLDLARAPVDVPRAQAATLEAVRSFFASETKPGDYFLTIPGYQLLYFLFDLENATAYPHVRRAFDSPAEEDAYIAEIRDRAPRFIFFQDFAIDGRPERRFALYAKRTMDWIAEHYAPVRVIGEPSSGLAFVVLERLPGAD
jgi:hypothetical protein